MPVFLCYLVIVESVVSDRCVCGQKKDMWWWKLIGLEVVRCLCSCVI